MCAAGQFAMYKQQTEKRRKEEIFRDKTVLYVSEKYIDALYYNEIFYSVECWNTTAAVYRDMKKLNSKSYKLLYLKENIRMRVIGLVWEDLSMHWSKNGNSFTSEELALHLKMIVSNQQSRYIPTKPPVLLLAQKSLPKLGTQ